MSIDMILKLKSFSLYLLVFLTFTLFNSCSAFKKCDCPGLESNKTTQTTKHS